MRPLVFTAFFLLLSLALHAQVQERKLMDRLSKPNMELEYNTSQSTFGNRDAVKTSKATSKEFGGNRSFVSKEFNAKTFGGAKQSWFASLFFSTKNAATQGKYEVPNAETKFDTKVAGTKDAREGTKSMDTAAYVPGDQEFLKPGHRDRWGRTQARLDSEKDGIFQKGPPLGYTGDLKPMSIDDVRELLNKNK